MKNKSDSNAHKSSQSEYHSKDTVNVAFIPLKVNEVYSQRLVREALIPDLMQHVMLCLSTLVLLTFPFN